MFAGFSQARAGGDTSGEQFDISSTIMHHVLDAHEWHVYSTTNADGSEHHVSIPLPVILWTDQGLAVFMSSAFHSANGVAEANGLYFKNEHEHIVYTDPSGQVLEGSAPLDFSITKNVASLMLAAIILLALFISAANAYKAGQNVAPKGMQNLVEALVVYIKDEVAIPILGEHKYKKYLPYILTVFFFIWINNLLGLVPTGANTSGNIAFTLTLAVITLLITVVSANGHYWRHIFAMPGVPAWLLPIVTVVEIIGIFTKPFALMIRLFANITAGHTIILSLVCLIFLFKNWLIGVPVTIFLIPMTFLELFVAALQAYVFTLLSALFISQAVADDHH